MDDEPFESTPTPPSLRHQPDQPAPSRISYPPPPPQVVEVVAKRGGLARAVGLVFGLMLFGVVFACGVAIGVGITLAGSKMDPVLMHSYRDGGGDTIAVVPIRGTIDASQSSFVRTAVDKVLSMSNVRAVVLRVDSPGGGVTSADQIWYQVKRLKDAGLPVVASYGGIAASGGYYVSCHADHIMAERTSITGSIGVIAQVFTMDDLMEKVGVTPVTLVATGSPRKDVGNDIFRSWSDEDRAMMQTLLDSAYTVFRDRVAEGRAAVIDDLDGVADGSVFTARDALARGLVDGIGYLDDAIREAERRGRIAADRATVLVVRRPPSLFNPGALLPVRRWPSDAPGADQLRSVLNDLASPRLMYLMN